MTGWRNLNAPMTHAPHSPALVFHSLEEVAAKLRESGGRLSAARAMVLETLFAADGPRSAEYIAGDGGRRRIPLDLASVYRNLERLEELGVVRHVHLGHGPGLYALVSAGEHEYLVCERCDRVTSLDPSALDAVRQQLHETFGYRARFTHFPIVGLCPTCAGDEHPTRAHEHRHGDRVHTHAHHQPHDHAGDGRPPQPLE